MAIWLKPRVERLVNTREFHGKGLLFFLYSDYAFCAENVFIDYFFETITWIDVSIPPDINST